MNELDQPEQPEQPGEAPAEVQTAPAEPGTKAQADAPGTTKKVEGRDPATVRLKRQYEAEVENKVASDYSHIVWAYGIIWTLFAIYGITLWRRSLRQKADVDALRTKINK